MLLFSLFLLFLPVFQTSTLRSGALFYISSFFVFLRHRLLLFDLPSFTYFRLGRSLWPCSGSSLSRGISALLMCSVQHARFFVFHWSASVVDFFAICPQKLPFSPVTSVDHEPFYTFFAEHAMFAHFLYSKVICPPRFHVGFSIELPLASPWRLPQPTVCKWIYFPSCSSRDLQLSLSRIEAILATPRRFKLFILQCSVHYLYIIRKSNFFSTHKIICFKPQNISKKIFAPPI